MGLAPIVKMSRRIPPTPVAAPWNGSMNEGWLCDSILNAQAHPSPMSMIPAFSPGPCTTSLLRVGNLFRCTREDLYEQCSLHITLKMPSSVRDGSRPPSNLTIFSYSSGVSPCSRITSGVIAGGAAVLIGNFYFRILRRGRKERFPDVSKEKFSGSSSVLQVHLLN